MGTARSVGYSAAAEVDGDRPDSLQCTVVHARIAPMILRLWSGRLLPGREAALMHRLRTAIPHVAATDVIDFTYGVRHDGDRMSFIVLSDWSDYDAVRVAAGGDPSGTVTGQTMDDLFETCQAEMYERLPPDPTPLDAGEGRVIGVVSGRVIPQHEASAQRMVDGSARAALDAGALAAHLGRRLDGELTRILVVVVWPKRSAMARFVRSREMPALDPAFTAHLVDWRFETYTMLSPERLMLPADAGPAVIVVDHEGRYVDTTPAIEAVLGVPGEVLYGRSLLYLAADPAGRMDLARRFLGSGTSSGHIDVRRPDGQVVRLAYRTAANTPSPRLHAAVLTHAGEPKDRRSVARIVADTLGAEAAATTGSPASAGLNPAKTGA